MLILALSVAPSADHAEAVAAQPKVLARTTGDNTELRETIPITRREGARKRVVASMGPEKLPGLLQRDRVDVTSEVQVTVDCDRPSQRCAGHPYKYTPAVSSRLVLAKRANDASGSETTSISDRQRVRCRQRRSARAHHCVIVFSDAGFSHSQARNLDCAPTSCRVNLVLDAHHRRASGGGKNKLVIGGNRPNGEIEQDKARLNAIRFRPGSQPRVPPTVTAKRRTRRLPLTSTRNVVYSKRLEGLRAGEQLTVDARMRTEIDHLPYSVRVNAALVLAEGRRETTAGEVVKRVASLDGAISEGNGFNCVHAEAPCPTEKVGVLTIERDVDEPLYVNLAVANSAKQATPKGEDTAKVARGGRMKVVRYPRELRG